MKFWHRTQQALPKFHFGTPLSVNRKMKDAQIPIFNIEIQMPYLGMRVSLEFGVWNSEFI
ncbi:MAG: hypothetical protein GY795_15315 [Desulfobacterales bacterium]|nr:hypothetical protein [Desulfobacterales bacterium]